MEEARCYECGRRFPAAEEVCPSCGATQLAICEGCCRVFSIRATECPNCGVAHETPAFPHHARRRLLLALATVIVLAGAGFASWRVLFSRDEDRLQRDFQQALEAFQEERFHEARLLLTRCVAGGGGDRLAVLLLLAQSHIRMGEPERSIPVLGQVLAHDPHDFIALSTLASVEFAGGRPAVALPFARRALEVAGDPGPIELLLGRILAHPQLGDIPGAVVHLRAAVDAGVAARDDYVLLGRALLALWEAGQDRWEEDGDLTLRTVQDRIREALEEEPGDPELLDLAACCAQALDRPEDALQLLEELEAGRELTVRQRLLRVRCRWDGGGRATARSEAERLAAAGPSPLDLFRILGFSIDVADPELAAKLLTASAGPLSGSPEVAEEIAVRFASEFDPEQAVPLVRRLLEAHPGLDRLHETLVELLRGGKGGGERAADHLRAVLANRDSPRLALRLAELLVDAAGSREALREAGDLLDSMPDLEEPDAFRRDLLRARLLLHEDRAAEAEPILVRLAGEAPHSGEVNLLLAAAYRRLGRPAREIRALDVLAGRDDAPELWQLFRAEALLRAGSTREALVACREVLQAAPENAKVLELLGRAARADGSPREAVEALERAVRLPGATLATKAELFLAQLSIGAAERAFEVLRAAALDSEVLRDEVLLGSVLAGILGRPEFPALLDAAADELTDLLAERPGSLPLLLLAAGERRRHADFDGARDRLRRARAALWSQAGAGGDEDDPEVLAEALQLAGNLGRAAGDVSGFLEACRRHVEVRPHEVWPRLRLMSALLLAGQAEAAVRAAEEARRQAPTSPAARSAVLAALRAAGRGAEIQPTLEGWVEETPEDPLVHDLLGERRLAGGDLPGAERSFRRALELDPGREGSLERLVSVLLRTERGAEAERVLRSRIAADPGAAAPRIWLARVLESQAGGLEGAVEQYRAVLDGTDPGRTEALAAFEGLLRGLVGSGRAGEAGADLVRFEFWCARESRRPWRGPEAARAAEAWYRAGLARELRGEGRRAEQAYRRSLRLAPGHPFPANNLANLLAAGGERLDEALALARSAAAILETRPTVFDTLGRVHLARGEAAEAVTAFTRAEELLRSRLSSGPDDSVREALARALLRRARARRMAGEPAGSEEDLRAAVETWPPLAEDPEFRSARGD